MFLIRLPAFKALGVLGIAILWATGITRLSAQEKNSPLWELHKSDRIVFLGSTFIERENTFAMMEMSLRLAFPELGLSVRNLGWSGDNVLGESRAYFGPVQQGYSHLIEYVKLTAPTVLIVSYGHNASFSGEAGLAQFLEKYSALLDDLQAENRRLIVLGPTPMETKPVILPSKQALQFNHYRRIYGKEIQALCTKKGLVYVDLLDRMLALKKQLHSGELTTNGVHLNRLGYAVAGEALLNSLGKSLIENHQLLLTDSQFHAISNPLEQAVLRKNELFFHRFRPENETYLRGFRKHEQGQNAKEIYEFDALISEQENKLAPLTMTVRKAWWK